MPNPLPVPATAAPIVSCRGCPEDDSICYSCQEDSNDDVDRLAHCEWRSDATSQVELSFRTESFVDNSESHCEERESLDDATRWMIKRFKHRLDDQKRRPESTGNSIPSSPSSTAEKNAYCAVPLEVLQGLRTRSEKTDTLEQNISRLAYVDEVIGSKRATNGAWSDFIGGQKANVTSAPFLCEGKIVRLDLDDAKNDAGGSQSGSPAEFLVTPRFDLTLEEYLQQMNEASVETR